MNWKKLKPAFVIAALLMGPGCAGAGRSWSSGCATNFGADWIVVQYDMGGKPFHCWKLRDTSITNEDASDGIYWKDRTAGHLVHVAGWYNRVQVANGDYDSAGVQLGVEVARCREGTYPAPTSNSR